MVFPLSGHILARAGTAYLIAKKTLNINRCRLIGRSPKRVDSHDLGILFFRDIVRSPSEPHQRLQWAFILVFRPQLGYTGISEEEV